MHQLYYSIEQLLGSSVISLKGYNKLDFLWTTLSEIFLLLASRRSDKMGARGGKIQRMKLPSHRWADTLCEKAVARTTLTFPVYHLDIASKNHLQLQGRNSMKGFETYLRKCIRREWSEHYVDYGLLKDMLRSFHTRRVQLRHAIGRDGSMAVNDFIELSGAEDLGEIMPKRYFQCVDALNCHGTGYFGPENVPDMFRCSREAHNIY